MIDSPPDRLLTAFLDRIDRWLSPSLRAADSESRDRARVTAGLSGLLVLSALVGIVGLLAIGGGERTQAVGVAATLPGQVAVLGLLRWTDRRVLASWICLVSLGLGLLGTTLVTGGLWSPALVWAVALPFAGSWMLGRSAARGVGAILGLLAAGVWAGHTGSWALLPVEADGIDGRMLLLSLTMLVLFLGGIAGLCDQQRADALRRRDDALRQLTERNQALREARDAAEAAARTRADFVARISHEIRTPMNGVLGMNELLLSSRLDREQREYAETVADSARALLGVINGILDFSRLEAGTLPVRPEAFEVRELVESVVRLLAGTAYRADLDLWCTIDPDVPDTIVADPQRVRQIVINLIGNAIKYTERGHVTIRGRTRSSDRGEQLVFEVTDTGIGIDLVASPPEQLFAAFSQVEDYRRRTRTGSGLGLAISAQLAELLDGTVEVESQPGRGSTFRLAIPLTDPTPAPAPVLEAMGKHFVVLDGSPGAADATAETLRSWGARAVVGDPGRPGAALATAPDAVLVDVRLLNEPAVADAVRAAVEGGASVGLVRPPGVEPPELGLPESALGRFRRPITEGQMRRHLGRLLAGEAANTGTMSALDPVPASPLDALAGLRGRVLIVEDNPISRQLLCRYLESAGLEHGEASNGEEAIELATAKPWELILMDCQMPVVDGYEASRAIRQVHGKRPPIVAVTAHATDDERERCRDAGMDDFLAKPYSPLELARVLERWLTG